MAGSILNILFGTKTTQIGNIQLDVATQETHNARSYTTTNPVEDGVDITDHVRLMPLEITLTGVISDTPSVFNLIKNPSLSTTNFVTTILGTSKRSIDAYNKIMELRKSRTPFTVITNLNVYDDMILEDFTVERNAYTANAIHFTAKMKQIKIVGTNIIDLPPARIGSSVNKIAQSTQNLGSRTTNLLSETDTTKERTLLEGIRQIII